MGRMTDEERAEKKREYNRRYYQANREKRLEYNRRWREENPMKVREYAIARLLREKNDRLFTNAFLCRHYLNEQFKKDASK